MNIYKFVHFNLLAMLQRFFAELKTHTCKRESRLLVIRLVGLHECGRFNEPIKHCDQPQPWDREVRYSVGRET
jgi:hypothetical protein